MAEMVNFSHFETSRCKTLHKVIFEKNELVQSLNRANFEPLQETIVSASKYPISVLSSAAFGRLSMSILLGILKLSGEEAKDNK